MIIITLKSEWFIRSWESFSLIPDFNIKINIWLLKMANHYLNFLYCLLLIKEIKTQRSCCSLSGCICNRNGLYWFVLSQTFLIWFYFLSLRPNCWFNTCVGSVLNAAGMLLPVLFTIPMFLQGLPISTPFVQLVSIKSNSHNKPSNVVFWQHNSITAHLYTPLTVRQPSQLPTWFSWVWRALAFMEHCEPRRKLLLSTSTYYFRMSWLL